MTASIAVAADAGSPEGFADDLRAADLGGVLDMGAAAELGRPALDVHHANHLTVLFAKQGHCAQLLGFLHRHLLHGDIHGVKDLIVDDLLHPCQLLGGHGAEVGKVEVGDGGHPDRNLPDTHGRPAPHAGQPAAGG